MFWAIRFSFSSLMMSAGELEVCERLVGGNVATGVSRVPVLPAAAK